MTPVRHLAIALAITIGLATPLAAEEVVVTRPPPAVAATTPATTPAAASSKKPKDDLPIGAPSDDYEFVGWCAGALNGHMQLFVRSEPTLKEISKRWNTEAEDAADHAQQQTVGAQLLTLFADAMQAAEKASPQALAPRGQRAIVMGRERWAAINNVDKLTQAYSYMNWSLPDRCERVASQLKARSTLMAAALKDNSSNTIGTSAVNPGAAKPKPAAAVTAPAPAPAKTVEAAKPAAVKPAATTPAKTEAAAKPAMTTTTTTTTKITTTIGAPAAKPSSIAPAEKPVKPTATAVAPDKPAAVKTTPQTPANAEKTTPKPAAAKEAPAKDAPAAKSAEVPSAAAGLR